MAYWLLKSEPETYGWDDLVAEHRTEWTEVRNAAAALHLKAVKVGDRAFFYHSGKAKAIAGIAEVTRAARQDGDDPRWVSVEIAPVAALAQPVTLAAMKATPELAGMAMLRQSRLSVSPVEPDAWRAIMAMGR